MVSVTFLKKYLSIHPPIQLNPFIYISGFSILKFGPAPALDQISYHWLSSTILSLETDHKKFS